MENTKHRNGIRYPASTRKRGRTLREEGKTHREIAKQLGVSISTADIWTKDIVLTPEQRAAIQVRRDKKVFTPALRKRLSDLARIRLVRYRKTYTRGELLKKIIDFHRQHHRIPLKREFNMYETYQRQFGSWNAAIRAAGFAVNPRLFAYKFKSDDGHPCDSFTESIIDNWLHGQEIKHKRNWRYGTTKMTADFFIEPNIIVEFFGLAGVKSEYDATIEKKRIFCGAHYIQLIEIYPEDVFLSGRLVLVSEKLAMLLHSNSH